MNCYARKQELYSLNERRRCSFLFVIVEPVYCVNRFENLAGGSCLVSMLFITVTRSISYCPSTKCVCSNCLKGIFLFSEVCKVGLLLSTDDMTYLFKISSQRGQLVDRKKVYIPKLTAPVPFSVSVFMVFNVAFWQELGI